MACFRSRLTSQTLAMHTSRASPSGRVLTIPLPLFLFHPALDASQNTLGASFRVRLMRLPESSNRKEAHRSLGGHGAD